MKKTFSILPLLFLDLLTIVARAQSADAPRAETPERLTLLPHSAADGVYRPVERGAHHRVLQRITEIQGEDGFPATVTNRYVEIVPGIHRWEEASQTWTEADDEIELFEDRAEARKTAHGAVFPPNLNDPQSRIEVTSADGLKLRSKPVGIAYTDRTTGQSVFIAELEDCEGQVVGRNEVLYPRAFGELAEVRYRHRRGYFAQDVLLRRQLPAPEDYRLSGEKGAVLVEVWTEFFDPPVPNRKRVGKEGGIFDGDESIDFGPGRMFFAPSEAFQLKDGERQFRQDGHRTLAAKQWLTLEGRTFLIEAFPWEEIREQGENLPRMAADRLVDGHRNHELATTASRGGRHIPLSGAGGGISAAPGKNLLAAAKVRRGPRLTGDAVVLDYEYVNGYNATFKAGVTYYCPSYVSFYGTITFEGGTVIKMGAGSSYFDIPSGCNLVFKSSAYAPVIITAKDDNSVGEIIDGSTGSPSGYYGANLFQFYDVDNLKIHDVLVSYPQTAFYLYYCDNAELANIRVRNTEYQPVRALYSQARVRNALFHNFGTSALNGQSATISAENLTANQGLYLASGSGVTYGFTNCLITAVSDTSGLTGANNQVLSSSAGVYQTAGGGAHYLASGSPYRNVGTTNIHPALLTDLRKRTTFAPGTVAGPITSTTTLSPNVARDTDTPDLGYHYAPLDWLLSGIGLTNVSLILTNGVAVGAHGTVGVQLYAGSKLISEGKPGNLNRFVRYRTVQENPISSSETHLHLASSTGSYSPAPEVRWRFTETSLPASHGASAHVSIPSSGPMQVSLRHGRLHGGALQAAGGGSVNFEMGNCLLHGVTATFDCLNVTLFDNTFERGAASFYASWGETYVVKGNLFDRTVIYNTELGSWDHKFNGYVSGFDRITPPSSYDVVLSQSPAYQASLLGEYYLPGNSPLINAGRSTAGAAGLYHFTTQTSQAKEGTSMVDIGFHYVAVDGNGTALDYDADGTPDYLEDSDGDGYFDPWETDWQSATSSTFKVLITQPKPTSNLP